MVKGIKLIGRMVRPENRGYWCGVYRPNTASVRDCPGCGRNHWLVGRMVSECAFCATALPIANASSGSTIIQHRNMTNQSQQKIAA